MVVDNEVEATAIQVIEPTPMQLMQQLSTNPNADPAKLPGMIKELVELKREEDRIAAKRAFDAAMAKCQKQMPTVVYDRRNSHTNSGYASLENVMLTCKPVWTEHGFAISFDEGEPSESGMVRVQMHVSHGDHTEIRWREAAVDDKGPSGKQNKTDVQGRQATFSYLQRQLLCSVMNIAIAGSDNDGNATRSPISDEQAMELDDLLQQAQQIAGADPAKFLAIYGVEKVGDIPAQSFEDAKRRLHNKISQAAG